MIHSSIGWSLHGEHPLQVIHHLIQDIRYLIVGFRNLKIERIESILMELVGLQNQSEGNPELTIYLL